MGKTCQSVLTCLIDWEAEVKTRIVSNRQDLVTLNDASDVRVLKMSLG